MLFYFAQSIFFDRSSTNQVVYQQGENDPRFQHHLYTRRDFEARLSQIAGIEFVVVQDPLSPPTGPTVVDGWQSDIWVISKRERVKQVGQPDTVNDLALYYILGASIFQARSLGRVLQHRLLNAFTTMTEVAQTLDKLPKFTPSKGHYYFDTKPKPKESDLGRLGTPSRAGSVVGSPPRSSSVLPLGEKPKPSEISDERTLIEAMGMTLKYRGEYMDNAPLVGEPGSFRINRAKDTKETAPVAIPASDSTSKAEKLESPAPAPPAIDTNVPVVESKKSAKSTDKTPTTPGGGSKIKRRKSKPVNSVTSPA